MVDYFAELRTARGAADAGIAAWAAALDQEWIDNEVAWHSGVLRPDMTAPRATIVIYLFNHRAHHRG